MPVYVYGPREEEIAIKGVYELNLAFDKTTSSYEIYGIRTAFLMSK